jgi:hypothetical protein
MPATYCSLHYHLVFSTKDRLPVLTDDWRGDMHAYLGGIVKNLNGVPVATAARRITSTCSWGRAQPIACPIFYAS